MVGIKRAVELPTRDLRIRFAKISKADWAEIALDMFCQYDGGTEEQFMADAERRLAIIKGYRNARPRP